MVRVRSSARSARRRPKPSNPGIITSLRTRSGGAARAAAKAAAPSATEVTSCFSLSNRRTYSRMSALSSAHRIRQRETFEEAAARRMFSEESGRNADSALVSDVQCNASCT